METKSQDNSKNFPETGLAFIDLPSESPYDLFKEWFGEAKSYHPQPDALSFCTSTKSGRVSARTVLLRRLEDDGVVIMTDRRSKKAEEIAENPRCAIIFLWVYYKDESKISRQVRMEGDVIELEPHQYQDLYSNEPLFCKIRSHICPQGREIEWEKLKEKHDETYEEFQQGKNTLLMPQHFVAYKILPDMMEFYYAYDNYIGDRIAFLKEDSGSWRHIRIAA